MHEELKKLTTAVSFDTWLKPLEVHHLDHDLKIALYAEHRLFERCHRYKINGQIKRDGQMTIAELNALKVGDYVRTISGNIDKVDALYGMIENTIHLENHKWQSTKNIVKHSKNIKNLLQIGDIIITNNLCGEITKIDGDTIYLANYMGTCHSRDIKTILTKEQFEANVYKLEEK